jgi:hypothetical protein
MESSVGDTTCNEITDGTGASLERLLTFRDVILAVTLLSFIAKDQERRRTHFTLKKLVEVVTQLKVEQKKNSQT